MAQEESAPVETSESVATEAPSTESTETTEVAPEAQETQPEAQSALGEIMEKDVSYELSDLNLPEGMDSSVSEKILDFANGLKLSEEDAVKMSELFGDSKSFDEQTQDAFSENRNSLQEQLDALPDKEAILTNASKAVKTMPEGLRSGIVNSLFGTDPAFLQWLGDVNATNEKVAKYEQEHNLVLGDNQDAPDNFLDKIFPDII